MTQQEKIFKEFMALAPDEKGRYYGMAATLAEVSPRLVYQDPHWGTRIAADCEEIITTFAHMLYVFERDKERDFAAMRELRRVPDGYQDPAPPRPAGDDFPPSDYLKA
jgi:hypothetical protein